MATTRLPTLLGMGLLALLPTAARADLYEIADLGTLPGGALSQGNGINGNRQVAGWSAVAGGELHAVRGQPTGTLTDLGTLGGTNSRSYAINGLGMVVGGSEIGRVPAAGTHAFCVPLGGAMVDL